MSFVESINLKTRIKTVFVDDQIVYIPVDLCDKCDAWKDLHAGYFQPGIAGEKLLWFCGDCK
jgi:hypothetical protein